MKLSAIMLGLGLAVFTSGSSYAAIIASNNFDSSTNLTGTASVGVAGEAVAFNGFTSTGDGWGVYDRAGGGPFALFDDTVVGSGGGAAFPTDSFGIAPGAKTDSFFGLVDTVNGEAASGMIGDWIFDISSATGGLTSIDMDFSAMGDFEASSDAFVVSMSIDGGTFTDIFTATVDEAVSKDYTLDNAAVFTLNDPLSINGTEMGNGFVTLSAPVTGSGSALTLRVLATINGTEAIGFDSIVVNGITAVPEPGSLALLAVGSIVVVGRRRRRKA